MTSSPKRAAARDPKGVMDAQFRQMLGMRSERMDSLVRAVMQETNGSPSTHELVEQRHDDGSTSWFLRERGSVTFEPELNDRLVNAERAYRQSVRYWSVFWFILGCAAAWAAGRLL